MPTETMTPRERWTAVLTRQKPDRVPMDYWATGEATNKLLARLGCDFPTMLQKLHIDLPYDVGPAYVGPTPPEGQDLYGLKYRTVDYGAGVYTEAVNSPLSEYETVEEIEASYTWPSIDWWDFSVIPGQVKGHEHQPIRGGGSEPFLLYKLLRGEEQAFIDLIENPEMVHYGLGKLYDLAYQTTERILEAAGGHVLFSYVAEDVGGQETLMYSPGQIREFFHPHMKRMIDLVHSAGAYVFHHTDGAVRDIIPDLVKLGFDVLNPIQWRCRGMEREGLKRDFGDKLVFHGAVDNQQTIPFGTVDDVREEVAYNLQVLGEGGGYILAPCHNIQAVGPAENVVALYEAGYELGWS